MASLSRVSGVRRARPLVMCGLRGLGSSSAPSHHQPPSGPALDPDTLKSHRTLLQSALGQDGTGKGLGLPLPPSRPTLYKASPLPSFVSRYYYLLGAMGGFSGKARVGEASHEVFASLEEQGTQAAWWPTLRLPHTWITEHSLVALHVWIVNQRLKVDYNVRGWDFSGRRMQEEVFARLWDDTTLRIRNAGVPEISVNKQLESVQRVTFDDFTGYDEALRAAAEDDGMELAAAVWKGVFREDAGADTEAVLRLADYTRREILNVLQQPREDVYRGWITWGPVEGEGMEGGGGGEGGAWPAKGACWRGSGGMPWHPRGRCTFITPPPMRGGGSPQWRGVGSTPGGGLHCKSTWRPTRAWRRGWDPCHSWWVGGGGVRVPSHLIRGGVTPLPLHTRL